MSDLLLPYTELLEPGQYRLLYASPEEQREAYREQLAAALAPTFGGSLEADPVVATDGGVRVSASRPATAPKTDQEVTESVTKAARAVFDDGRWH